MDLSVVIVNYNGRDLTLDCLETVPAGVETIVVDNGSADGSADAIARRFPSVHILRNHANRGFAAAVNQGVERSAGKYVCLLNNDARLPQDSLGPLVDYLEANPDAGIVAPQLLHEDGRRQHSFANIPSLATELLNKSLLRLFFPRRFPSKRQEYAEPIDVESVIGACLMIRRDLIRRIGVLDERFFLFLEETDWCLRARAAGSRVVFVPGSRVVHLQGRTRAKVATRARIEYVRSLFSFFRKHNPASYPLLRAIFPLKNLVEILFLSLGAPFSAGTRRRWRETVALLAWQVFGGPRSWGLSQPPRYVPYAQPGHGWWVAEGELDAFRDFNRRLSSTHVLKDLRHKKTIRGEVGHRKFLVKIYKEGSAFRRLKSFFWGSKALAELRRCVEVLDRGVPTVPILAAGESRDESCVVFPRLERWSQLQETLLSTDDASRRALLFEYGRFARRVHDAGIWQYDFNPTNVLVRGVEFKLIDFEKTKVKERLSAATRYRSLAKMNRVPQLSRPDRLRFLKGYLDSRADERARLKAIAREILRHGAAQSVRDVARSERRCVDDNRDFGPFDLPAFRGWYRKRRPHAPDLGLTLEELTSLAESDFRVEPAPQPLEAWKQANRRAKEGGPPPLAVLIPKDGGEGKLVFGK